MAFIETVPEDSATDAVAALYEQDRAVFGFLPNFTRLFSHRPEVYAAWRGLNAAIKANMEPRRYELATMAAARYLRSSYCTLAHGKILVDDFLAADAVRAIVADFRTAGLDPVDVAVMELAETVARDATAVTAADIDRLRELGLADDEIMDVVLAASARCFFSKTLDALAAPPDARYGELDPELRETLTVGRPIEGD